jgi:hypothetical protein
MALSMSTLYRVFRRLFLCNRLYAVSPHGSIAGNDLETLRRGGAFRQQP